MNQPQEPLGEANVSAAESKVGVKTLTPNACSDDLIMTSSE